MNTPMMPLIRRDRDADRPEAERVVAVLYEQIGEINKLVAGEEVDLPGAVRPSFGIFNDEAEVDELLRMLRVIRDRAWKGEYGEIPGAAACKEL